MQMLCKAQTVERAKLIVWLNSHSQKVLTGQKEYDKGQFGAQVHVYWEKVELQVREDNRDWRATVK